LNIVPHGRHADSQPLIDALSDGDEALRVAAVICLGLMAQATDVPALYAATSDPSPAVQAAANAALERLKQ
jgi:HEAT repeat protein